MRTALVVHAVDVGDRKCSLRAMANAIWVGTRKGLFALRGGLSTVTLSTAERERSRAAEVEPTRVVASAR